MDKVTPLLISGFSNDSVLMPYVSSHKVAFLIGAAHEWVCEWINQSLPKSMKDMVIPVSDYWMIHVDLFLTAEYEQSGVLH